MCAMHAARAAAVGRSWVADRGQVGMGCGVGLQAEKPGGVQLRGWLSCWAGTAVLTTAPSCPALPQPPRAQGREAAWGMAAE